MRNQEPAPRSRPDPDPGEGPGRGPDRRAGPDDAPRISAAEWDVMDLIWTTGGGTAQELAAALGPRRDWSDRTVKTLLARLVKKGVLGFEEEGRRYRYRPLVSREACVRAESASFLERVFGGSTSPLLAHFVREGRITREELDELHRLLDEREDAS